MSKADHENDHSDEIAAALAAVYAYCQSEAEAAAAAADSQEDSTQLSNWGAAGRMEGITPGAGRVTGKTQLRNPFFTWRNSFSRRWTAYSILFLTAWTLVPCQALAFERIQFAPESQGSNQTAAIEDAKWQPRLPAAPAMLADPSTPAIPSTAPVLTASKLLLPPVDSASVFNTTQVKPRKIRVAISTSCKSAEIVLPDGAQLLDEKSNKLLAELPPQSLWQLKSDAGYAGKRISFTGKTGSSTYNKVLLASGLSNYEPASYTKKFVSSGKTGFTRPPRILDSAEPRFDLPVKTIAVVPAAEQDNLRPVAVQSTNAIQSTGAVQSTGTAQGSNITIAKPASPPPVVSGYVISTYKPGAVISVNGKTYRGNITIKPRNGEDPAFLIINEVDLEDYLLSVLPSEMPSSWSLAALKAQCIAARSYALANLGKHASEGYDLKASTEDQVYLGVQTESAESNRAVAETAGQVLKHNGKVVTAFFHSASGGATEVSEHVYGSKLNYLKSVPDFDDQSPHFAWNRSIPVASIEQNLKKQGRDIGGLLGIFPLERSQSQRISSALLCGTLQTLIVSGEELRRVLELPSTVFNLGITQDAYLIAGRGFGHGLGMSQWGAKFLSEQGYNAAQILSYYYKDVSVEKF